MYNYDEIILLHKILAFHMIKSLKSPIPKCSYAYNFFVHALKL